MLWLRRVIRLLQKSEEDFRKMVIYVESGQGAVGLLVNGLQEVVEVRLGAGTPALLAEGRLAIVLGEVFNEALRSSRRLLKEEISRLTGIKDLPEIPGIF